MDPAPQASERVVKDLGEGERLELREQLEALSHRDGLDEDEEARRWSKVKELGGKASGRVLTDLALPFIRAKVQEKLGI